MGRRPIADGVRATRCTHDGHREHATSPTKKNTHPTHLRASLPFSSSRSFLDSDESADGQPSTQHEIHKAHQTARVCIQALRVIYFTLSSPGFAPCGANVSTSPPSCRPRGKSSVDGHMQHMIEIPAACAHCSCCTITFRCPESFCAKAAELEHTNMHRQRVHAHRPSSVCACGHF